MSINVIGGPLNPYVIVLNFCDLRGPPRPGVGNYFRPRATLRLYLCHAGRISVKKGHIKLKICPSRAVRLYTVCGFRSKKFLFPSQMLSQLHQKFKRNLNKCPQGKTQDIIFRTYFVSSFVIFLYFKNEKVSERERERVTHEIMVQQT